MWDDLKKGFKAVFFQGWYLWDEAKEKQRALFIIVGIILLVLVLISIPGPAGKGKAFTK